MAGPLLSWLCMELAFSDFQEEGPESYLASVLASFVPKQCSSKSALSSPDASLAWPCPGHCPKVSTLCYALGSCPSYP